MTETIDRPAVQEQETRDEPLGWCVVELLGHRRLAGYVSEQSIADAKFLRVAVPTPTGGAIVQFVTPASVYALTPATEDTARRAAASASFRPEPVSLYEVGQPPLDADDVATWLNENQRLALALRSLRQRDWIPTDDGDNAVKLVEILRNLDLPF